MKKCFYQLRAVKSRKPHICSVCEETIPKGARTLVENGFNLKEGYFTNYFCPDKDCISLYLDCQQPSEMSVEQKTLDESFFGQIWWIRWKE